MAAINSMTKPDFIYGPIMQEILFVLIIAGIEAPPIVYADYNITSNYCKTEFNTTKWIQSHHNCTLNITSGFCSIKQTYINSTLNPNTFTKVGLGITTTATQVTHQYGRKEVSYLYHDYGVGYFTPNSFTLEFTIKESSVNIWRNWISFGIANDLDACTQILGYEISVVAYRNVDGATVSLLEHNNGVIVSFDSVSTLNQNVWYYCTYLEVDNVAHLYIYSDSGRTNLVRDLSMTLVNDDYAYRYLYLAQSNADTGSPTTKSLGYSKDYLLRKLCYLGEGVLYTKELLSNTTLKSLMMGINGTAPTNTRIRAYTSPDNATWLLQIDNNGLGKQELYEEMLYEYTSLYVRINMTTTDATKTPYLDELFYLHTLICGGGVAPSVNPWWLAILFIFTPISIVLLSSLRKGG